MVGRSAVALVSGGSLRDFTSPGADDHAYAAPHRGAAPMLRTQAGGRRRLHGKDALRAHVVATQKLTIATQELVRYKAYGQF
jgi:hypothetical protein